MSDTLSTQTLIDWLSRFRDLVVEQQGYLTDLDSAIGDADHGANMARGMNAVIDKLATAAPASVDQLFKTTGMTLVSSVGGASGPLYGTFFLRAGAAAGPTAELDAAALGAVLRAAVGGIVDRGKAELGDKTMFDALEPALEAYDAAVAAGASLPDAVAAASSAADAGRDATEPLGPQGSRELPRGALGGAPRSGRRVVRPASAGAGGRGGAVTVGLVVVSHSAALAEAAWALAGQMVPVGAVRVALAAGTDDGGVGTDAVRVAAAIEEVASPDGVLVLTDLGSAVLSAETALEFVDLPGWRYASRARRSWRGCWPRS